MIFDESQQFRERRALGVSARVLARIHVDLPLLAGLVPLPAGLPLLMGGLGVLGAIGARRKHRRS